MSDKFIHIPSGKVAAVELLLVAGSVYTYTKTDNKIVKSASAATAIYLAYGAYLNSKGRVKVLKGD